MPKDHPSKARPTRARGKKAGSRAGAKAADSHTNFRFYDNRQKYLLFVMTCGEKWAIAERVGLELEHLKPNFT